MLNDLRRAELCFDALVAVPSIATRARPGHPCCRARMDGRHKAGQDAQQVGPSVSEGKAAHKYFRAVRIHSLPTLDPTMRARTPRYSAASPVRQSLIECCLARLVPSLCKHHFSHIPTGTTEPTAKFRGRFFCAATKVRNDEASRPAFTRLTPAQNR
jgi:hypothetical protein